jgi:alpha-galactosidase
MHGDSCSSEDDDEAAKIIKKFRDLKKKMKEGQSATLDDVVLKGSTGMLAGFEIIEDGYGTPYVKSSEEEASEVEANSEGELIRNNDGLPRFKKSPGTPIFSLGMKFRSKQQFKKEIIRYGLTKRKCIKFVKDDPTRVRAKCEWKHCPWVILLSTNTRTESWQIITVNEFHTCPPRRDNMLVTARRIAERYEKFIMANPTWNYGSMKHTVLEEMFADVNIAKLKRAKAMVM